MIDYSKFEHLLNETGMTATEVAKEAGVSRSALSDWKSGRYTPKLDKIQKLAEYFGVGMAYFMDSDNNDSRRFNDFRLSHLTDEQLRLLTLLEELSFGDINKATKILSLIQKNGYAKRLEEIINSDDNTLTAFFETWDYMNYRIEQAAKRRY